MLKAIKTIAVLLVFLLVGLEVNAQTPKEEVKQILFTNVIVFDGLSDQLNRDMHVLISSNKISEISSEPLVVIQFTDMQVSSKDKPDESVLVAGNQYPITLQIISLSEDTDDRVYIPKIPG